MAKRHKDYTESEIRVEFGLKRKFKPTPLLAQWIDVPPFDELSDNEYLLLLLEDLQLNVDTWNEDELELFFIGPILKLFCNYRGGDFMMYSQREISAQINGIILKVKSDFMLAKGDGEVLQIPYFCFHEYKRTKKNPSDPIAQLLQAMLIAQEMNKNGKPVYGAYVIGKDWYFMVMEGKEYCISESYRATNKQELLQIIAILRAFRVILETTLID
jgi:hypothetical protein